MSKERARRRAEREAAATRERERRQRERRRRDRLRALAATLTAPVRGLAALGGRRRPDSALRRQRVRQDLLLLGGLVAANGIVWLAEPSWTLRAVVAVASALAWPVLVVLVFDRRRST